MMVTIADVMRGYKGQKPIDMVPAFAY
jgi:hypothetical protein